MFRRVQGGGERARKGRTGITLSPSAGSSSSPKASLHLPSPRHSSIPMSFSLLLILSSLPCSVLLVEQNAIVSLPPSIPPSLSAASRSFVLLFSRPSFLLFRYRSPSSPSSAQFFSTSVQRFHPFTHFPCLTYCAGASAVLLAGGGRADFPSSLGSGSGRTQLHVVCGGTRPLWLGPGRFAQGPVCHPTAGLEGRAAQVRTPSFRPAFPNVHEPVEQSRLNLNASEPAAD